MDELKPFAVGDVVWVVERDEDGVTCGVAGFVFLAAASGFAIVSPTINGSPAVEDILADAVQATVMDCRAELEVYPLSDCYKDSVEAQSALYEET